MFSHIAYHPKKPDRCQQYMNERLFAVVIPVYNGENHIRAAIESCLTQTVLPDEIIVIDDASVDGTKDIIDAIPSPLIQYFRNDRQRGPSFSRNLGMRVASGKWVMFLDADDLFHSDKIRVIRSCLADRPEIRAIGHSFRIAEPGGYGALPVSSSTLPKKIGVSNILLRNPAVTPSLTVAKDNNIWFDENNRYAEDHDFILRTAEQHGFWFLDLPLCLLGRTPLTTGGLSGRRWDMRKGEMKMYIAYCKRNHRWLLLPFLLLFSLCKHLKNGLIPRKR